MAKATNPRAEISALVNEFTDNLIEVVKRAVQEQVRTAVGTSGAAGRGRAGRKGGRRVARLPKLSPAKVDAVAAKLLTFVKKNAGLRGEQISKALRTTTPALRTPMLKLMAERKVKTKGQRRGTTYYAA